MAIQHATHLKLEKHTGEHTFDTATSAVDDLHSKAVGNFLLSIPFARLKTSPSKCDVSLNRSGGYQLCASLPLSKLVGRDVQIPLLTCADNSDPKPYLDVQGTPLAVASNRRCAPLIFATSQSWNCPEQHVVDLHLNNGIGGMTLLRLKGNLLSLLSSLVARQKTSPSKCDVSLNRSGGYQLCASLPLSKLVGRDVQIPLLTCADNSDPKPYLDVQGTPLAVARNRRCAPLIFATSQSWKCPAQNVISLHLKLVGETPLLRLKGNLRSLLSSLVARQKTSPIKCDASLNRSGGFQLGAFFPLSNLVGRDVQIRLLTCRDNSDLKPFLDIQGTRVAVASNRPCAPLIFVTFQSWIFPEQNVVDLHFYGIGEAPLLRLKGNLLLSLLSSLVARQKTSPSKCDVSLNQSSGYQLGVSFPLSKLVGRDVQIPLLTCPDNSHPKPYFDVQGTLVAVASNRRCAPLIFVTSQSWKCPEQNDVDLHIYGIGDVDLLGLEGNLLLSSLVARLKTSPCKCGTSLNQSGGYQLGASVPLSNLVGRDVQIPLLTCPDNSHPKPYLDVQGTPVAVASNRPCAPLIFVTSQSWKCPEQNVVDLHFYGIGDVALLGLRGNVLLSSLVARQKTSPSKCGISLNQSGGYQLGASVPLSNLVGRDVQIRLLTCADNSDPKPYLDVKGTSVAVASNRRCAPLILVSLVSPQSWKCPEQHVVGLHFYGLEGNLLSLLSSLVARQKTSPSKCDVSLNRSGGYQRSKLVGRDVQIRLLACPDNSHPKPYFDVQGTPVAVASNRPCAPLIFVTFQSWIFPEQNVVDLHFCGIGEAPLLRLKGNLLLSLLSSLVARQKTSPCKCDVSLNQSGGYQLGVSFPLSKLVGRDVQIPLLTCPDNSHPKPYFDVQGTLVAVASNRRCAPLIFVTSQSWKCPEQNDVDLHIYGIGDVDLLGLEGNLLLSSLVARLKTSPCKCDVSLNQSGGYQLVASVPVPKLVGKDVQIPLLTCPDNSDLKTYFDMQGTPVAVASNRPCAPLIFVTSQSWKCPEQNVVDLHFYGIGEAPLLGLEGNLLLSLLSSLVARHMMSPSKCDIFLNRSGGNQRSAFVPLSKLAARTVQIRLLTCADNSGAEPYLDVQGTPVAVASNRRCVPLIIVTFQSWKCPEQNVVDLHFYRIGEASLLRLKGNLLLSLLSSLVARQKTSPCKCDVSLNRSGGFQRSASVRLSKLVGRDVQICLLTCADNSHPKPHLHMQGTPVAVASNRWCVPLIFATSQSWKCPEQNFVDLHFYGIGEAPLLRLKGNLLSLLSSLIAREKTSPSKCDISLNRSGAYQRSAFVPLSKLVGRDVQIPLLTCADNSHPKPYLDMQGTPVAVASNRRCAPLIFVTSQSWKCLEQNVGYLHSNGIGGMALLGLEGNLLLLLLSSLVARQKTSPCKCDVSLNQSGGYQLVASVPVSKLVGKDVQIPLLTCPDNSDLKTYFDMQGTPVAVASNRPCAPLIFVTSQSWKCPEQNVVDLHFYGIGEAPLLGLEGNLLLSLLSSLVARHTMSPSKCGTSLNQSGGYQLGVPFALSKLVGRDVQIRLLTCADNSYPKPYLDVQGTPVAVASNRRCAPLISVTSFWKYPEQNVVGLHQKRPVDMALLEVLLLSSLVARQKTSPSKCGTSLNQSGGYQLCASVPLSKLVERDVLIRLLTCADNSHPKPYLDVQGTPVAVASNRPCAPLIFVTSQSWKCPEQNVVDLHFYRIGDLTLLRLKGNLLLSLLSSLVARQKTSPSKCDVSLNRSGGFQLGASVPLSKLVGRDVQIRLLTCANNSHPKPYLDVEGTPVAVASNQRCAPLIFVTSQSWKCPEQNVGYLHSNGIGGVALLRLKGNLLSLLSSLVARQKTSPSKCDVSLNRSGGYQRSASVPLSKLVGRDVQIRLLTCANNSHPKPYLDVQGTPVAVASNHRCAPLIFVTSQSWKCPQPNVGYLHSNGMGGMALLEGNLLSLLSSLVATQKTSPSKCGISLNRSGGFQLVVSAQLSKLVGRDVQIRLLTCADNSHPKPYLDVQRTPVAVASNQRCAPLIFVTSQSWKCPEQNVGYLHSNGIGGVALLGLEGNLLSLLSSLVARQKTSPSKCDVSLNRSGGFQLVVSAQLSKLVGRDVQIPLLTCADNSHPKPYLDVQRTPVAVASNQRCVPLIFVTSQSWKCPQPNVGYLHSNGMGGMALLGLEGNLLSLLSSLVARQKTSPSKCDVSLNRSGGYQRSAFVPLSKLVGRDVQIPIFACADNSHPKPYLDVQGTPVAVASNRRCVPLIFVISQSRTCREHEVVNPCTKGNEDTALIVPQQKLLLHNIHALGKSSPSERDNGVSLCHSGRLDQHACLIESFQMLPLGHKVNLSCLTFADRSDLQCHSDAQGSAGCSYLHDIQRTAVLSPRVAFLEGRNAYMKPAVWKRSIRQLVNHLDSDGSCLQVLLPSRLDARKVEPGCFMLGLLPFQPRTWPSAQGPKAAQFALHFTKVIAVVLDAAMNGYATIPRVEPHSHSGAISKPPTSLQMQKPIHQSQDRCRSRCYRIRTTQYHQTSQADTQGQAALSHAIFALDAHDTMQSTWPMMNIAVEIAEEAALLHGEADAVAVRCICRLHYVSLTLSMLRLSLARLARPSPVTAALAFAQSSKSLMLATNGFRDSRHQLPQQRCEARSGSKWRFKEA